MQFTTKRVEVGEGIHRLVEYAWTSESGKVVISMQYEGRRVNPIVIYSPIATDSPEQVLELVELWTKWMYEFEQK